MPHCIVLPLVIHTVEVDIQSRAANNLSACQRYHRVQVLTPCEENRMIGGVLVHIFCQLHTIGREHTLRISPILFHSTVNGTTYTPHRMC